MGAPDLYILILSPLSDQTKMYPNQTNHPRQKSLCRKARLYPFNCDLFTLVTEYSVRKAKLKFTRDKEFYTYRAEFSVVDTEDILIE